MVRLAGDALDQCRRRVQQDLFGRRGMKNDPLYKARRTLHTGASLLTDKQKIRLDAVFASEEHVEVEATWGIYQRTVAAYREPDENKAKQMMRAVIDAVSSGVPVALTEVRRLGRTLKQRAADVLAFFDRPGTSNGPTEAILRPARAPPRLCARFPQPHPLHRSVAARSRRVQIRATPLIPKSPFCPGERTSHLGIFVPSIEGRSRLPPLTCPVLRAWRRRDPPPSSRSSACGTTPALTPPRGDLVSLTVALLRELLGTRRTRGTETIELWHRTPASSSPSPITSSGTPRNS